MVKAGTVDNVPLRDEWPHEEDFSRWLAENIERLNEQVKWELTPVQLEAASWNATRYVDVLCEFKSAEGDETFNVVIENQFDGTDNDHFSRMMQYISIHDAKGAVWIGGYAYPEHVQVMQWLNDNSQIDAYLFTVHVERQADSTPKPVLTLVSGPDTKRVEWDFSLTRGEKIRNWWGRVLPKVIDKCEESGVGHHFSASGTWRTEQVPHADSGISEFIKWYIYGAADRSTVGIYVPASPRERSHFYFDQLEERRQEIDEAFSQYLGKSLSWERSGSKFIVWYNPVGCGYECDDDDLLEREADAVAEAMKRIVGATKDVIAGLEPFQPM